MKNSSKTNYLLFLKYISTIISWTIFVLLSIIGALLIYYFASSRLYVTKGDKYEPFFSVYTIVSGSMEPTIKVYDVIINTKVNDPKDIKVNDVITFTSTSDISNGKTVTHRVIGIREMDDGGTCYVTRGDNNTTEDPSCATYSNVIGKVSAVVPGLGKIQFFLASKFGWLLIIVVPALYIIVKDLLKLFKMSRNKEDEETTDNIDNTMVIGNLIKRNNLIDEEENEKNEFITHRKENESNSKNDEKRLPVVSPKTDLVVVDDDTENENEEISEVREDSNIYNEESYDRDITELEERDNVSYEDDITQDDKNSDDDKSMDEDNFDTTLDSNNLEEPTTIEYDYSKDFGREFETDKMETSRVEDNSNKDIEIEENTKDKNNFKDKTNRHKNDYYNNGYNKGNNNNQNNNSQNKNKNKKKKNKKNNVNNQNKQNNNKGKSNNYNNNNNNNNNKNNNQYYRKSNNSSFYNFFDGKSD